MNSRRVLVVEDDEGLRHLIKKGLVKAGFEASGAALGDEAIGRVSADAELVLLLDQKLPDMAGTEIIARLGELGLRVPFIVMTGQGDEKLAVEMMKLGASDYLVKGMDLLDLLPAALERLFRERETEMKLLAAEKTLREREAQLLQAQKLESVGRLAGGVAHDFNNMLGVILGHTELALAKLDEEHPVTADLVEVRKAAERSTDLTRQLLAYARKQTITPKVLDLNVTVDGMLRMLGRLMGEEVELIWRPAEGLWPVCMDPGQIDQIMSNLCVNARDAMTGHGRITIETAPVHRHDDFQLDHPGVKPGDYLLLRVTDNGFGMDEPTLDRLFEPFFTTKAVGLGTGLGLATVYGIVRQNDGFITVQSQPGKGSTFSIYLPRYRGPGKEDAPEMAPAEPKPGHETILVVEDETTILEMIRTMLEAFGYRVLAASTPGEAIRLAQTWRGEIHLLMTDVIMPEMNGRDLARTMLSLFPDMKRVFMSGYTADVIAHHGVLDEGVFFLQKPFTMKMLANRIREALER
jgi:signal transduction histidine kinase